MRATAVIHGATVPVPDQWTSDDGINVQIIPQGETGDALAVLDWQDAPDSDEAWHRLESELEDRVRLDVLGRLARTHVRWQSRSLAPIFSGEGWATQRRAVPLSTLTRPAAVLRSRPAARDGVDLLRQAFDLWFDNNAAALSRLFIAAEGVVLAIAKDDHTEHWASTARQLGLGDKWGLQLFYSLQRARHAGLKRSDNWFAETGVPPLEPWACVEAVQVLLHAYLDRP